MLKKLEKESKNLKGKLKEDESRARKKIANLVEISELTIESFRLEFGRVDEVLRGKSKEFHSQLDTIKAQIEKTINSFFNDSRHKKQEAKEVKAQDLEAIELIQLGDDMQDDGIERLLQLNRDMDINQLKVNDINEELFSQGQKLANADSEVKDIDSTLKRAKKIIMYFSEELYQDKCIRILVLLIVLTLIAICALIFFKKK